MFYKYINIKAVFAVLVLFQGITLTGCTETSLYENVNDKATVDVRINMNIPGVHPQNSRAMAPSQESEIAYSNLQILVFEETEGGDIFRYKASIEGNSSPLTVKVKPSTANEKYRFVAIANTDEQAIAVGTPKSDALNQYLFSCLGKWNTSDSNPRLIPMWGEQTNSMVITGDNSVSILMHRSLARIDIGNLFKFNNPDPKTGQEYAQKETDKESVWGLENFKIKDIRIYRTKAQAFAATSSDRIKGNEVVIPNIPPTANYNSNEGTSYATQVEADMHPLIYTLADRADSYIREIYVPESTIINDSSNSDNVPCIVVGGYYGTGNTTVVTYYRADFANYSNGIADTYKPILRNHRYLFDIKSVSGPGFETPEQALKSFSSPISFHVTEWNEVPLNYHTQGQYFLSIANRNIWLEATPSEHTTENMFEVSYNTNLELDGSPSKQFTYSWEIGTYFDIAIDYINKKLIFKAKENTGADIRSDKLTLRLENIELRININQKASNINYLMNCESVKVHGVYGENIPLNHTNFISMKISSSTNIDGIAYEIKTLEKNGIYFLAEGNFQNGQYVEGEYIYEAILNGFGTPVNETGERYFEPFNLTIVSNSINNTVCTGARITPAYKPKRILTIGANAIYLYGYMLEPNTASRAFMDASVNFGLNLNSTVPMAANANGNTFTIEVMTAGKGMIGEVIDYNYLLDKLNTFKPDIILTGQAVNYYTGGSNTNVIELINRFVDEGGVFLMCNGYYPNSASATAMVNRIVPGVKGTTVALGSNRVFSLPVGDEYEADIILNGPFGDMRGKLWGSDGDDMHTISGLTTDNVNIYSTHNGSATMFRHKTKPFFYIGEGGFISNPQRYIGGSYTGSFEYCPFAIDANYRPIPRTNFTATMNKQVYNSLIFANIITWAVDYSEYRGIKYPDTGNKFP